jgi:hypothetical protein
LRASAHSSLISMNKKLTHKNTTIKCSVVQEALHSGSLKVIKMSKILKWQLSLLMLDYFLNISNFSTYILLQVIEGKESDI